KGHKGKTGGGGGAPPPPRGSWGGGGGGGGGGARSGGGSTSCPRQGRAQNKLSKEGIPRRIAPESIPRRLTLQLIIDDHAPWNAADRDRDGGLAAVDVDHCDVIAEAICHEHGALVARERDTPGALADQNVARNLAGRHVDHRHMRRVAEGYERGLAVLGHDEPDRRDVALAHAGRKKLDLAGDLKLRPIDDVDLARELGRDPQLLAIR